MTVEIYTTSFNWSRVHVLIKNPDGSAKEEISNGRPTGLPLTRYFILHHDSSSLYLDEPTNVIRLKCLIIALVTPIFASIKAYWYAARTFLDSVYVFVKAIHVLNRSSPGQRGRVLLNAVIDLSMRNTKNVCRIVCAPILLIGMIFGAIYGIYDPYLGRRIVSQTEGFYNQSHGLRDLNCLLDALPDDTSGCSFANVVNVFEKQEKCFLAVCFQKRGKIDYQYANVPKYCILEQTPLY